MKNNEHATRGTRIGWLLAACGLWAGASAHAAGHFDIDDAATLDPGQCQYETWWGRTGPEPVIGFHLGPACRIGPVELGFNLDRLSTLGVRTVTGGPQIKWNFFGPAPDATWSAAVSAGTVSDFRTGGRTGGQLVLPVTWRPTPELQIHANLGADWAPGTGQRTARGGLACEWALNDTLSLIAERSRVSRLWTSRVGARLNLTPLISLDLSASRTGPQGVRGVVIGLNHEFSWN